MGCVHIWGKTRSENVSCSVVSLQAHGLQPARLPCSWGSPSKNPGVGSHSLLCGIFSILGLNLSLLHFRQIIYCLSHQGSPQKKQIFLTKSPPDSPPHPQHPPGEQCNIYSLCVGLWAFQFIFIIRRYSPESDFLIFFKIKISPSYFKYQERARRSVMVQERYLVPFSSINCNRTPFRYRNARRCIMILFGLFPPLKYSP